MDLEARVEGGTRRAAIDGSSRESQVLQGNFPGFGAGSRRFSTRSVGRLSGLTKSGGRGGEFGPRPTCKPSTQMDTRGPQFRRLAIPQRQERPESRPKAEGLRVKQF